MSGFEKYYKEIIKGLPKYENIKTVDEVLKSIELDENYDKLDNLEKARIVNTYVAKIKNISDYFEDQKYAEIEDYITLHTGRAIEDWTPDVDNARMDHPKFNLSAILAAEEIGMI